MILLFLCLITVLFLQYCELKKLCWIIREHHKNEDTKKPPKARGSFVIKRFEERIKEALYE